MKECWKKAIERFHQLGLIDAMPTICPACKKPFRYSDDVVMREDIWNGPIEGIEPFLAITFSHAECLKRLEN